jgi:hypothetical protein
MTAPIRQRLGIADVSLHMAGNDLSQSGKWRNFSYLVIAGGKFCQASKELLASLAPLKELMHPSALESGRG